MLINEKIFKAYDIRGIYPDEINEAVAFQIGRALAQFFRRKKIVIGRDMRLSSEPLFSSLTQGILDQGGQVIDIGLVSTDALYFASGRLKLPAVMITASHLPRQYNGFKICRAGAEALSQTSGLKEIAKLVQENIKKSKEKREKEGKIIHQDILSEYRLHVLSFINLKVLQPLKVVVDAGNGMAGKIVPLIFENLPFQIIPLYFKLDGSFPHHSANPLEKDNLKELQKRVLKEKADLGIAFDGDGDRVFFVDEKGEIIKSSLIIALLSQKFLEESPGEKIIYNLVCSRIVPETIKRYGGKPLIERVGHSFIKARMKKTGAVFAGEASGHYYFRKNFRADSGIIAALIVLEMLSKRRKPLSLVLEPFKKKYFAIEEVNFKVKNKNRLIKKIEAVYRDAKISHLDGLTVSYPDWWFNLRPSNTEPVVRLNLEAVSQKKLADKFKEIKGLIKETLN